MSTSEPTGALRRPSGSTAVYAQLRRRILTSELAPGERLKESEMSRSLGVSRTPYREAVRLLMAEGLLEQQPTGGVVVPMVSAREIEELYSVRAALEGLMAADAARRATRADLATLRGLLHRNARLVDLPDEAQQAGHALHLAIAHLAGNAWASRLHAQVDVQMERYRTSTNESPTRRAAALEEHGGIVEAVEQGDSDLARARATAHVLAARDVALSALPSSLS